jgi:hypothetical protein
MSEQIRIFTLSAALPEPSAWCGWRYRSKPCRRITSTKAAAETITLD